MKKKFFKIVYKIPKEKIVTIIKMQCFKIMILIFFFLHQCYSLKIKEGSRGNGEVQDDESLFNTEKRETENEVEQIDEISIHQLESLFKYEQDIFIKEKHRSFYTFVFGILSIFQPKINQQSNIELYSQITRKTDECSEKSLLDLYKSGTFTKIKKEELDKIKPNKLKPEEAIKKCLLSQKEKKQKLEELKENEKKNDDDLKKKNGELTSIKESIQKSYLNIKKIVLKSIKNRKEYTNKEKQEIQQNEDNIDLLKQKKEKLIQQISVLEELTSPQRMEKNKQKSEEIEFFLNQKCEILANDPDDSFTLSLFKKLLNFPKFITRLFKCSKNSPALEPTITDITKHFSLDSLEKKLNELKTKSIKQVFTSIISNFGGTVITGVKLLYYIGKAKIASLRRYNLDYAYYSGKSIGCILKIIIQWIKKEKRRRKL